MTNTHVTQKTVKKPKTAKYPKQRKRSKQSYGKDGPSGHNEQN